MKLVTWNVNSINARIEHLTKFIQKDNSDIYLIQELKCINDTFPYEKSVIPVHVPPLALLAVI